MASSDARLLGVYALPAVVSDDTVKCPVAVAA